jgi:hypothetical protein
VVQKPDFIGVFGDTDELDFHAKPPRSAKGREEVWLYTK